ncbi:Leucine Rich Repeat [Seminavis robusta]|uniref:Leucine Rich Repeat n=1 Tax=Seminavis robusta TaxID=568900 RepID=A0A9N8HK04_9STRA|nr:Leucine Rich Repeat [Seminavis robusta]|eukprot:Sro584_g170820.1 Leucine Rich Repeat (718) ;mRNA; r:37423-39679
MQWIEEAPTPNEDDVRNPVGVRVTFLASSMRVLTNDDGDTLRRQNWYLKNNGNWRQQEQQQQPDQDDPEDPRVERALHEEESASVPPKIRAARMLFLVACLVIIGAAVTVGIMCGVGTICNAGSNDSESETSDHTDTVIIPGQVIPQSPTSTATTATTNSPSTAVSAVESEPSAAPHDGNTETQAPTISEHSPSADPSTPLAIIDLPIFSQESTGASIGVVDLVFGSEGGGSSGQNSTSAETTGNQTIPEGDGSSNLYEFETILDDSEAATLDPSIEETLVTDFEVTVVDTASGLPTAEPTIQPTAEPTKQAKGGKDKEEDKDQPEPDSALPPTFLPTFEPSAPPQTDTPTFMPSLPKTPTTGPLVFAEAGTRIPTAENNEELQIEGPAMILSDNELVMLSVTIGFTGVQMPVPDYTVAALLKPSSPQSRALQWMSATYTASDLVRMPAWRMQQIFALAVVYYSLEADTWEDMHRHNWLNASLHECEWAPRTPRPDWIGYIPQIYCVDESDRVSSLNFYDVPYLDGVFPPELELLSSLESVRSSKTLLDGKLEAVLPWQQLQRLENLTEIRLGNSFLTSTIPLEVSRLTKLTHLDFFDNELVGTLHSEIGLLRRLKALRVPYNNLTGTIPSELGMTKLTTLDLAGNNFSGEIPTELALLTDLHALYLELNTLSEVFPFVPESVCKIRSLKELWVDCYNGNATCAADCDCFCFSQIVP